MHREEGNGNAIVSQQDVLLSSPLIRALRRARRVWWRGVAERTIVLGLIAAAGATIVTWPLRWVAGASGAAWNAANLPWTLAAAGAGFLLATVGLLVVHAIRAPSLLAIARRSDHALGQQQRLSTAFEVLLAHGERPSGIVPRLLLADVERRLSVLDLGRAVRSPTPRPLLTTLVGMAVTAGIALAVPVPTLPTAVDAATPVAPSTSLQVTPESVDETAALAQSIAESLASETLAERDPFLRAVAEGFADVALQLQEGTIDVAEANEAIADLLSYLGDATQRTGGSLADLVREAVPEGIDRGRGEDSSATMPSIGGNPTDSEDGREPAPVTDRRTDANSTPEDGRSALERLAEALERRAEERAAAEAAGGGEVFGGEDGSNPYGPDVNVVREAQEGGEIGQGPMLRAEVDAAGRAAGAAERSSDAAGDAAGGGSADLNGPAADFERADAQVDLAPLEAGSDEGANVEASFAPTEAEGDDRRVTTDPPDRAFDRARESGTPGQTVGWAHRDVVQRYFLPDAAAAAEASP